MNTTAYILGILIQFGAAVVALLQARTAPRRLPWFLIAFSSLIIVARRSDALSKALHAGSGLSGSEALTFFSAVLFFLGVLLIGRFFQDVAKSRRQLEESEENYHTVADFTYDWELWIGPDGRYKYISPSCRRITGYGPDAFTSDPELFLSIVHPGDRPMVSAHLREEESPGTDVRQLDFRIIDRSGSTRWINHYCVPVIGAGGAFLGRRASSRDITERKQLEEERRATIELLRICNAASDKRELMKMLTGFLRGLTGCDAVGVRLREGEDFPYCETRGFPEEFVLAETRLCAVDQAGEIVRDSAGNPVIECMCGNVICGRFDPAKPFFTPFGSFFSGCTTELLASTTEADRQVRTRNRCNGEGYETVVLIPLRWQSETFGLFQFNDKRKEHIRRHQTEFLETLAGYVAASLAKLQTDEALKKSEATATALLNATPDACQLLDAEGHILELNDAMLKRFKCSKDGLRGRIAWSFLPEELAQKRKAVHDAVFASGRPAHFEDTRAGRRLENVVYPVQDPSGAVTRVAVFSRDITEAKKAEEALMLNEARLSVLVKLGETDAPVQEAANYVLEESVKLTQSAIGFLGFISEDQTCMNIHAWSRSAMAGCAIDDRPICYPLDKAGLWGAAIRELRPLIVNSYADPSPLKKGLPPGHIALSRLIVAPLIISGRAVAVLAAANRQTDYTETDLHQLQLMLDGVWRLMQRRNHEEQTLASLREKEILLREIHHRVKNNIAVISSLLSLQSHKFTNPHIIKAFDESQDRIRSMALIHNTLYQADNLARVDMKHYIHNLSSALRNAYAIQPGLIDVDIQADDIFLDLDRAISCGLILNELFTNALKHGFPDKHTGTIGIDFSLRDNLATLVFRDNGQGIPENIDLKSTETLGLQLVGLLAEQLGGTVALDRSGGTTFTIQFPAEDSPKDAAE